VFGNGDIVPEDLRLRSHGPLFGQHPIGSAPLVGRLAPRRAVARTIESSALVTLTGAGGIGKSRLALAVAETIASEFVDGVCWIDLSTLPVNGSVDEAILSVLTAVDHSREPSIARLADVLRDRQMLLVLDNCEHVLKRVASFTASVLVVARGIRILATSREVIGSPHERVIPVEPLSLPPDDRGVLDASTFEAVALFVQRAMAVRADFALDEANVGDVVAICRELEGWPLAIELAASRVRSLTVQQIRDDLKDRMAVLRTRDALAPERHQSLRAVVDWSWRLCDPTERMMWRRTAVFAADGFDLEAARLVCSDEQLPVATTWDVLDRLVSKSILVAFPRGGRMRYRFLDTMRHYGDERRTEAGEADELDRRHRDYCLMVAADAFRGWDTERQRESIELVRVNKANLVRAMEWSLSTPGESNAALDIAWRMVYHWAIDGSLRDGRRWLTRTLEAADHDASGRAMALWALVWVIVLQGDSDGADQALREMEASIPADPGVDARIGVFRGFEALRDDDIHHAVDLLTAAVDRFGSSGEAGGSIFASMLLVLAQAQAGSFDQSDGIVARAVSLSERCGERWGRAQLWWALGYARWLQGDSDAALELIRRGVELIAHGIDLGLDFDRVGFALKLEVLAWIAASRREYERSARLLGAARATWDAVGASIEAHGLYMVRHAQHCEEILKRAMPIERLEANLDAGAALSFESLLAYATGEADPALGPGQDVRLTRREREVSEQLGRGLGSQEIAAQLSLSARTVEGHIGRAMMKLGFDSRTKLAAWAAGSRVK
jgi:predicted ATPase/DNA-binding CsgD family transcriptional regulator